MVNVRKKLKKIAEEARFSKKIRERGKEMKKKVKEIPTSFGSDLPPLKIFHEESVADENGKKDFRLTYDSDMIPTNLYATENGESIRITLRSSRYEDGMPVEIILFSEDIQALGYAFNRLREENQPRMNMKE